MRLTAAITRDGSWWVVARCLEVEITGQGETFDAARANLVEALELYFEDEPSILRQAGLSAAGFETLR